MARRSATPAVYGDDRVFVRMSSGSRHRVGSDDVRALDALAAAGHPVIDLAMGTGSGGLGAEFFRWEFATAVAGAVLGINPFDEPNVTESKDNTKRVLDEFRHSGALPAKELLAEDGRLRLYGDAPLRLTATRRPRDRASTPSRSLQAERLLRHPRVRRVDPGARRGAERDRAAAARSARAGAVTVGYGPRFLHSTGQLHKGGAPIGCFIQLTADYEPADDLPIPGLEGVVRDADRRAGRGRLHLARGARPAGH